jgi:hypothetical protein
MSNNDYKRGYSEVIKDLEDAKEYLSECQECQKESEDKENMLLIKRLFYYFKKGLLPTFMTILGISIVSGFVFLVCINKVFGIIAFVILIIVVICLFGMVRDSF